jgi:cytochrome c peroxidase
VAGKEVNGTLPPAHREGPKRPGSAPAAPGVPAAASASEPPARECEDRRARSASAFLLLAVVLLGAVANCTTRPRITTPSITYREPVPIPGLPASLPLPRTPLENPYSIEKEHLGRLLFYDQRLSFDGSMSCASCHRQELAFTDGLARAVGATGERHQRNTMTLTNVAFNATFTWSDPNLHWLEDQALVPMRNLDPIELGLAGREDEMLARLRGDDDYPALFAGAFPEGADPITLTNVVRAIATFERVMLSADSTYDRYLASGDPAVLGELAHRGMELFFSEALACGRCHAGFNLSGPVVWHESPPIEAPLFHNTGLYNLPGGRYPDESPGVSEHTGLKRDRGKFRAPTLRNVALTAPYMHDGSIESLEEVVAHYAAGGRARVAETEGGAGGRPNPHQSELVRPQRLSEDDRRALVAFLDSLTDWTFVCSDRLSDPFEPGDPSDPVDPDRPGIAASAAAQNASVSACDANAPLALRYSLTAPVSLSVTVIVNATFESEP